MDYRAIFQDIEFDVDGAMWLASVEDSPGEHGNATDQIVFQLSFIRTDSGGPKRRLRLVGSDVGIHTQNHVELLYQCVRTFLRSGSDVGESECF